MNKIEKVLAVGIIKEKGWLYFIDKDGDISRTLATVGKYKKEEEKTTKEEEWKKFIGKYLEKESDKKM